MSEHEAVVQAGARRISAVWIVPIVAVVLGAWMVGYNYYAQGPVIEIHFTTAAGIEAEKTRIRARDVEIGVVDTVRFTRDFEGVVVEAQIEKFAERLLRDDTEFWVVRPRIGAGGVSGLGTIVSGAYIELSAGSGSPGRREFQGLEDPPITTLGTPGLHLTLFSDRGGSVGTGDAISFRGITVGKIEDTVLDLERGEVRYDVFIEAPYDTLITSATRFWNASGISFSASAAGVSIGTESLQSLIAGGVAFDLPEGVSPGEPVAARSRFELHPNLDSINETPYQYSAQFVVSFTQSLRGLMPGAPVEMRGIRIGTVDRVLIEERARVLDGSGGAFPVLIRIEPGRFRLGDTQDGADRIRAILPQAVGNGLRASLQSGNLLTGSMVVALDYYPDAEAVTLGEYAGYPELPTISGGLQRIELQMASILETINALPLDAIGRSLQGSLQRLEGTLAAATRTLDGLDSVIQGESTQTLPLELTATLSELRALLAGYSADSPIYHELHGVAFEVRETLANLESFTRTLEAQPNAVIFGRKVEADPQPMADR